MFLHGYGANGNDLLSLGQMWQELLPDTAFASPHAPEPCDQNPSGRQWFGLTRMNPALLLEGATRASVPLNAFLDAELARTGVAGSQLALVGFSQGTMMSLYAGLRRSALAGVLGYSGLLIAPERLEAEIKVKPPVFLIHGDADMTVPVEASVSAVSALGKVGVPAMFHLCEGLGHGIDQVGLAEGGRFLASVLSGSFAR